VKITMRRSAAHVSWTTILGALLKLATAQIQKPVAAHVSCTAASANMDAHLHILKHVLHWPCKSTCLVNTSFKPKKFKQEPSYLIITRKHRHVSRQAQVQLPTLQAGATPNKSVCTERQATASRAHLHSQQVVPWAAGRQDSGRRRHAALPLHQPHLHCGPITPTPA